MSIQEKKWLIDREIEKMAFQNTIIVPVLYPINIFIQTYIKMDIKVQVKTSLGILVLGVVILCTTD